MGQEIYEAKLGHECTKLIFEMQLRGPQIDLPENFSNNPIRHGVFDRDIFMGGGLKDPQPKTGLNLVQSLCQSYHVTRSLA